ncbi:MAG: hypothetical protein QXU97_01415 [Fervidicoccaceae archaeon]
MSGSERSRSRTIFVGGEDPNAYALRAIVMLREAGEDEVVIIKGRGENISKAIDIYNEIKERLGDGLKLVGVSIGSEKSGKRKVSYIEISLKLA